MGDLWSIARHPVSLLQCAFMCITEVNAPMAKNSSNLHPQHDYIITNCMHVVKFDRFLLA